MFGVLEQHFDTISAAFAEYKCKFPNASIQLVCNQVMHKLETSSDENAAKRPFSVHFMSYQSSGKPNIKKWLQSDAKKTIAEHHVEGMLIYYSKM